MFRGLTRCLEPVSPRRASPCVAMLRGTTMVSRRNYERFRRSGDGRKRNWWEERSAASQDEYFRRETARQLKEIRERGIKRKAEEDGECECSNKKQRRMMSDVTPSSAADVPTPEDDKG